ncbi:hypothetical protein [Parabacteroides sp.]
MAEGREQAGGIVGGIGVEAIGGEGPFLRADRVRGVAAEFIERAGRRLGDTDLQPRVVGRGKGGEAVGEAQGLLPVVAVVELPEYLLGTGRKLPGEGAVRRRRVVPASEGG